MRTSGTGNTEGKRPEAAKPSLGQYRMSKKTGCLLMLVLFVGLSYVGVKYVKPTESTSPRPAHPPKSAPTAAAPAPAETPTVAAMPPSAPAPDDGIAAALAPLKCKNLGAWGSSFRVKKEAGGLSVDCFYGSMGALDEGAISRARKLWGRFAVSVRSFVGHPSPPKTYKVVFFEEGQPDRYGNPQPAQEMVTFSVNLQPALKEAAKYPSDGEIWKRAYQFFVDIGAQMTPAKPYWGVFETVDLRFGDSRAMGALIAIDPE